MVNKVIAKYPENGAWEGFFGNTSVTFNDIDLVLLEIGGYVEADGLSLRQVKETCLKNGYAGGEDWSVSFQD